jgi:hypothetical protein
MYPRRFTQRTYTMALSQTAISSGRKKLKQIELNVHEVDDIDLRRRKRMAKSRTMAPAYNTFLMESGDNRLSEHFRI